MDYHHFQEITIHDLSDEYVASMYDLGFVFTRLGYGIMHQVRSVRVRLHAFEPTSENRRVEERSKEISLNFFRRDEFPYHWSIGKLAKDFYEVKFGPEVMSANKIKELFTQPEKSNMNSVLVYNHGNTPVGYCLAFSSPQLLHYSYPFYQHPGFDQIQYSTLFNPDLPKSMGIAMMTKAIQWAKDSNKEFVYLGSIQDALSLYKFQFKGTEWFDGAQWREEKPVLQSIKP